jgi:hypothetical protein
MTNPARDTPAIGVAPAGFAAYRPRPRRGVAVDRCQGRHWPRAPGEGNSPVPEGGSPMVQGLRNAGTARRAGYGLLLVAGLVGCQSTDKPSSISLPSAPPPPSVGASGGARSAATPSAASRTGWNGSTNQAGATDSTTRTGSALPVSESSVRSRTGASTIGQNPPISVPGQPTTGGNLVPISAGPPSPVTESGWTPSNSTAVISPPTSTETVKPNYAPPSGIKNPLPIDLPTPPGPPPVAVPSGSDIVPPSMPASSRGSDILPPAGIPSALPGK